MQQQVDRTSAEALRNEIARFMNAAVKRGNTDLYQNRRSSVRYHRSWPLFVTRMDTPKSRDLSVTLHNISNDGIGFLCDEGIPVGSVIGVKLFWSDPEAPRVPAVVRHVQITQEGILVGAQFMVHDHELCSLVTRQSAQWYG